MTTVALYRLPYPPQMSNAPVINDGNGRINQEIPKISHVNCKINNQTESDHHPIQLNSFHSTDSFDNNLNINDGFVPSTYKQSIVTTAPISDLSTTKIESVHNNTTNTQQPKNIITYHGHNNGQQSEYQSNQQSNTNNNNDEEPDENNNNNNNNNNDNNNDNNNYNQSGNNGNGNGRDDDDNKNNKNRRYGPINNGIENEEEEDENEEEEEGKVDKGRNRKNRKIGKLKKHNIKFSDVEQNFYFGDSMPVPQTKKPVIQEVVPIDIEITSMDNMDNMDHMNHMEDHEIISELTAITDLKLEKEISDILEADSKSISNAKETTVFDGNVAPKPVKKKKKRKKTKNKDKNSGISYNPNAQYRAQGNIQISKQLTVNVIPEMVKEDISNIYAFMDKCTALCQSMEETNYECNGIPIRIFNYGFHDKATNETLYCIVERQSMDINAARGYKWKMMNKLYTAKDIKDNFGISEDTLPKSFRKTAIFKSYLLVQTEINNLLKNKEERQRLIDNTPWHRLDIYNKINNKRRMTLSLTKPEFMRRCIIFANNMDNMDNNMENVDDEKENIHLVPILMFNNNEVNEYWIEWVWIVRIEDGIDVGIAFKLNHKNEVKVGGIHLDKAYLQIQHELVLLDHDECHCFDGFQSNINYLAIGNPDDHINKIKYYQQQIQEMKQYKEYITSLLEIPANNIPQLKSWHKQIALKTNTKLPTITPLSSKPSISAKSMSTKPTQNEINVTKHSPYNANTNEYRTHHVQNINNAKQMASNIPMTSMQQQQATQMRNNIVQRSQIKQQMHHKQIHSQLQQMQQMQQIQHLQHAQIKQMQIQMQHQQMQQNQQIQQIQPTFNYTMPTYEAIHSTNSLTPHAQMYGLNAVTPSNISPTSSYNTITPSYTTTTNANVTNISSNNNNAHNHRFTSSYQ